MTLEHPPVGRPQVVGFADDADIGGEFEDPALAAAAQAFKDLANRPGTSG